MDSEFLGAIKSQTIPMRSFDTIACFTNIPYVFFYENTHAAPDFMPTDLLKKSLYKTLADFPFLLADITTDNCGRGYLTVNADSLNLPDLQCSTSQITYGELKAQKFAWSAWPKNTVTAEFLAERDAHGRLKMVHINIVRLADNSGLILFANVHHYAIDAKGSFEFLNQWARNCAQMQVIMESLPEVRRQGSLTTRGIFRERSILATLLAHIPMDKYVSSAISALGDGTTQGHIFRIMRTTLDTLRADLQEFVPEGTRISDNDMIVALVSKTIGQSQNEACKRSWLGAAGAKLASVLGWTTDQPVELAVDTRRHLGIQGYVGGALIIQHFVNPLKEVYAPTTLEGLAKIVVRSRNTVDNIDAGVVRDYVDITEENPQYMFRLTAHSTMHGKLASFSNHSRRGRVRR
ncbi:hypothetical protein DL89DRAFT_324633 [Linderina pennispora]|uniref:CoA-dependent acyltransferase n=1 Tax=Linderina pennispora TaxID=61395 RepID=A0A1Y1W1B5_9FUNG|nr:uncharacterized protein DL89DRAFT_324633 [Linderina pennispora]ORX67288.1 hypothetical protein DL89DRAFT_324633 [Linderina pennispora]